MMDERCLTGLRDKMSPPSNPMDRVTSDMTFEEWIFRNYGETPDGLEAKVLRVDEHNNTGKVLEWYRRRFLKERDYVRSFRQMNLFN